MLPCMKLPSLLLLALLPSAPAAVRTWTGNGANANWSTPANWSGNLPPAPADSVVFPAGATQGGPLADAAGGEILAMNFSGAGYVLDGPLLRLTAASSPVLVASHAFGTTQIDAPLELGAAGQSVSCTSLGSTLVIRNGLSLNGRNLLVQTGGVVAITNLSAPVGSTTGTVTTSGSGRLSLSGSTILGRDAVVQSGELRVAGTLTSRSSAPLLTVADGATLSGTGSLSLEARVTGTLAPGNGAVGTITVEDLTFTGSGAKTLAMEITSTANDLVVVAGEASLDAPVLSLSLANGTILTPGTAITLVRCDGGFGADGMFLGLPEATVFDVSGQRFRISYAGGDGNDITLTALAAAPTGNSVSWLGTVDGRWSHGPNWSGGQIPAPGDRIVFGTTAATRGILFDLPGGAVAGELQFGGGSWTVTPGPGSGPMTLTGVIEANAATSEVDWQVPLVAGDHVPLRSADGGGLVVRALETSGFQVELKTEGDGSVHLHGAVSGGGSLVKTESGWAEFGGSTPVDNPFSGRLLIREGEFRLNRAGSVLVNGFVEIDAGSFSDTQPVLVQNVPNVIPNHLSVILGYRGVWELNANERIDDIAINGPNHGNTNSPREFAIDAVNGQLTVGGEIYHDRVGFTVDGDEISLITQFRGSIRFVPPVVAGDPQIIGNNLNVVNCEADLTLVGGGSPVIAGGNIRMKVPQSAPDLMMAAYEASQTADDPNTNWQVEGRLVGSGSFARLDFGATGILSPGAPTTIYSSGPVRGTNAGVLETGDLFLDGATFEMDLTVTANGSTSALTDRLVVNGTVRLDSPSNGAHARLVPFPQAGAIWATGYEQIVIDNGGNDPISGTFEGIAQNDIILIGGIPLKASYTGGDGNDFSLTRSLPVTGGPVFTFTAGGPDDRFSTAANWQENAVPASGHGFSFPPTPADEALFDLLPALFHAGDITISGNHGAAGMRIGLAPGSFTDLQLHTRLTCSATGAANGPILWDLSASCQDGFEIVHSGAAPFEIRQPLIGTGGTFTLKTEAGSSTRVDTASGQPVIIGTGAFRKRGTGSATVAGVSSDIAVLAEAGNLTLQPKLVSPQPYAGSLTVGGAANPATLTLPATTLAAPAFLDIAELGIVTAQADQALGSLKLRGGQLDIAATKRLSVGESVVARSGPCSVNGNLFFPGAGLPVEVFTEASLVLTGTPCASGNAFIKTRRGSLVIAGRCDTDITVAEGSLFLHQPASGNNGAPDITVQAGSVNNRLGGDGAAGSVVLSGALSPGVDNTGTFTCTGFDHQSGPLEMQLARNGSDRLVVQGSVRLRAGVTLALSFPRQVPLAGTAITLIDNDGSDPIAGNSPLLLPGTTVTAGGHVFQLSATGGDGNDLVATRVVATGLIAGPLDVTFTGPPNNPRATLRIQGSAEGPAGASIQLQRSTDLNGWTTVATVTADAQGVATFDVPGITGGDRVFFRYRLP